MKQLTRNKTKHKHMNEVIPPVVTILVAVALLILFFRNGAVVIGALGLLAFGIFQALKSPERDIPSTKTDTEGNAHFHHEEVDRSAKQNIKDKMYSSG